MTTNLPDDMFIENANVPGMISDSDTRLQPGLGGPGSGQLGSMQPGSMPPGSMQPAAQLPRGATAGRTTLMLVAALSAVLAIGGAAFAFGIMRDSAAAGPQTVDERRAVAESGEFRGGASPAELYDSYLAMSNDESIFEIIPRTDEGWDYFRAFMYKLTDYKTAEMIGGRLDSATLEEMYALERRFLALEDLELTVDITRTDGTRFYHDGKPPSPAE